MQQSPARISSLGKLLQEGRKSKQLTQEQLAQRSGVPYTTLTKVESGAIRNPSAEIVSRIAKALGLSLDTLFTPQIFHGPKSLDHLFQDALRSLKRGDVMCISGIEERRYLQSNADILGFIARIKELGISQKLLSCKGDTNFLPGEHLEYRWIEAGYFSPVPIYVYADRVAILMWGPPQQTMIVQNSDLSEAYRRQFHFLWDHAQEVPKSLRKKHVTADALPLSKSRAKAAKRPRKTKD